MTTVKPLSTTNMVFVESRSWKKTESSTPMTFVTVADATVFERFEFIADKECNTQFTSGQPVDTTFKLSNYNGRPSLQLVKLELKK